MFNMSKDKLLRTAGVIMILSGILSIFTVSAPNRGANVASNLSWDMIIIIISCVCFLAVGVMLLIFRNPLLITGGLCLHALCTLISYFAIFELFKYMNFMLLLAVIADTFSLLSALALAGIAVFNLLNMLPVFGKLWFTPAVFSIISSVLGFIVNIIIATKYGTAEGASIFGELVGGFIGMLALLYVGRAILMLFNNSEE